jgi:hypothetical protein
MNIKDGREISKFYHELGLPLCFIKDELKDKNIKISWYAFAEGLWDNNFPSKRIISMLKAEDIIVEHLDRFLECLEQPLRANGGYEESRDIIFNSLFDDKEEAIKWLKTNYK